MCSSCNVTILRDFSAAGPCIPQGVVTNETATALEVTVAGSVRKVLKRNRRFQTGLLHTEPCRSCRDHPQTQYPNGYEN